MCGYCVDTILNTEKSKERNSDIRIGLSGAARDHRSSAPNGRSIIKYHIIKVAQRQALILYAASADRLYLFPFPSNAMLGYKLVCVIAQAIEF